MKINSDVDVLGVLKAGGSQVITTANILNNTVTHALSADTANSANWAESAGSADSASEAGYAYTADSAYAASYADSADAANSANWATGAGSADTVAVADTRGSQTGPNLNDKRVRFDFKSNSTDGLNDGGIYHGVMTFQQWTDASGGGARQLGFTDNDNLWIRGSGGGLSTWGAWKQIIHSGNIGSQSVNYAGSAGSVGWSGVSGKPSTFTPSAHYHYSTEIYDSRGEQDLIGNFVLMNGSTSYEVSNYSPNSFAAYNHAHAFSAITSKPTSLGGYGITDGVNTQYNSSLNTDSRNSRGVTRLYRADDNSDYSVQVGWCRDRTGYWSLWGMSGDNYHAGVFVAYSGYSDHAYQADYATWFGDGDGRVQTSYDGGSYIDIYSPDGYTVRVGYAGFSDESAYAYNAQSAESSSWANSAGSVAWAGVTSRPSTLDGFGITGGKLIQNNTAVDFLTLVNQHGASQDKSYIRFKHYTDNRESANIRAEVGYPSNGGWNGALVFATAATMGANSVATDQMVLDKDGNLKLLNGGITANNIKSLSAFGAKSAGIGAIGPATAYTRNITIDGVTVSVFVAN